jgi:hypothetical protein
MNRIKLCVAAAALLVMVASCSKDDEPVTQLSETMEFTFTGGVITLTATAQNMVVDWGDGKTNEYTDAANSSISHTYQNDASHTVRIQAEELSLFLCNSQHLTALDVSRNTKLTRLDCYGNQLTALNVSNNTKLTNLGCFANQLTALDVSHNTELIYLYCFANQLTALDVSSNTELIQLYCYGNQLTALNVFGNTKLTELYCYGNQLTTLDVSRNTKLTTLSCRNNQFAATALNDLFTSLPTVQSGEIYINNNPGAADCNRSIATNKGWVFRD